MLKAETCTTAIIWLLASTALVCAGPESIARDAKVTVSSQLNDHYSGRRITDGIIGLRDSGEWASKGQTAFWGYVKYPWVQLDWPKPQWIEKVILYDRPALEEHLAGGTLEFSDGSEIAVTTIPNDGTAKVVTFEPRKVTWIRFVATDGDGKNLGLSEIEVYPGPQMYRDCVSWVDPYIETARGRWFFFSTASRPFGMICAAPHTRNKNQWGGGYNYNSTEVLGFGQIHAWMLSGLEIMPVTGAVDPTKGERGWKSKFSHDDEIVQPGYHRLFLRDYKIWVDMTSTDRVSFYRLSYTKDCQARILVNLSGYLGGVTMTDASVSKVSDTEIEGSFSTIDRLWGGPKDVKIFFVVRLEKPFKVLDAWKGGLRINDISTVEGDDITVAALYDMKAGDTLGIKAAISYTSIANARSNLICECDHWDFDLVRQDAKEQWNRWLGKIDVEGGTRQQKTKFYTDLWHVLLGRHKLNDFGGDYPDYTQGRRIRNHTDATLKVRTLPKDDSGRVKHNIYNSDALWLTQWNLNVLWGLAWPSVLDDFSASLVQYGDNGGLLPRGPCAGGYSYIMTGCPSTSLIVSTYMKGLLKKVDAEHAYNLMRQNHMPGGMMGVNAHYINEGFSPGNAGTTVQWAFEDWVLAQMARKLDKRSDCEYFLKRSGGWKKLYHQEVGLLLPKNSDGSWLHTDPLSGRGWVEANAWQGTWSVSHDIAGLVELMGGRDRLCEKLSFAFEKAAATDFVFAYGGGHVSYANQPGCSNAHVFNHAGKPWLTQYWVRRVNEQAYGAVTPDRGYGGHDEDQGQMGGVSALMSIGLFSLRGTTSQDPIYEICSPVFDQIVMTLDNDYYPGSKFTLKTYDNSAENCYIQRARLNDKPLGRCWFYHRDFVKGGLLELWLGSSPNQNWGVTDLPAAASVD
ncbi:MAG: GH92 family glycosyl hydrolase [Planctomycetota bacterium]|jgi:predicted alpha-1,2-mannosidase